MQTNADPCRPMYTHAEPCRCMQTHVGPCRPIQAHSGPCRPMQAHAGPCRPMQAHSDPFRPIQTHAEPCRPMQTHAGSFQNELVSWYSRKRPSLSILHLKIKCLSLSLSYLLDTWWHTWSLLIIPCHLFRDVQQSWAYMRCCKQLVPTLASITNHQRTYSFIASLIL